MEKHHILLVGGKEDENIAIGLMVESYNHRITIIKNKTIIINEIGIYQNKMDPIDLLLVGSNLTSKEIKHMFTNFKKHNLNFPFIILSNKDENGIINYLLEKKFYGYIAKPDDTVVLMNYIQILFKNIKKYMNYNG